MMNVRQTFNLTTKASCTLLLMVFMSFHGLAETLSTESSHIEKKAPLNQGLQLELLAMQQAIVTLQQKKLSYPNGKLPLALINEIAELNNTNSIRLQEIIKQYDWPTIKLVGIKGRDAAFIILQQSDNSLQESLLPLLQKEFEQGQLSGQKLASFIDIMLIKSGKKQRYGTQLAIVNGQIVFNEIVDKDNLEKRRKAMNMIPISEYEILLKKMYQLN